MRSLTRAQSRAVDRIAMDEFGMLGLILMENAARGIAGVLEARFPEVEGPIAIVCGPGNNGGDGFAVARHLANAGRSVRLHLLVPADAYPDGSDPAVNLAIVAAMGLEMRTDLDFRDAGLVVDAVFGTGLSRPVREPFAAALRAIVASGRPVVAVDLPSGLDADTGEILGVAVRARVTATMVAPKAGFSLRQGPAHVGEVEVVDIGVPREVVRRAIEGNPG